METHWKIEKDTSGIEFSIKYLAMANVKGLFKTFDGSVITPNGTLDGATININIETASIFTNQPQRDQHLQSPDWFDTAKYPSIAFASTHVKKIDGNEYSVKGNLTIKDKTNVVEWKAVASGEQVDDGKGNLHAGYMLSGIINKKDFGVGQEGFIKPGILYLSNDVALEANIDITQTVKMI